jgi:hypothetical protein
MKEIPLTQGKVALVDDEDYEYLMQWKWHAHRHKRGWAAARRKTFSVGVSRIVMMHRELMNPPDGLDVDHIDHNELRNCRVNLRICSRSENNGNQRKQDLPRSSKFKGVTWHKDGQKWMAQIQHGKKHYYLGLFGTEQEAARSYDNRAVEFFGFFACLNFPGEWEVSI